MLTKYRIYDLDTNEIIANGIDSREQATEVLYILKQNHPESDLEIESYTQYTVTGLGRDPDLH